MDLHLHTVILALDYHIAVLALYTRPLHWLNFHIEEHLILSSLLWYLHDFAEYASILFQVFA